MILALALLQTPAPTGLLMQQMAREAVSADVPDNGPKCRLRRDRKRKTCACGGDGDRALGLIAQARMSLPNEPQVVNRDRSKCSTSKASHPVCSDWMTRHGRFQALSVFRSSVEPGATNDKGLRGYFEALRAEIKQRSPVHTQVPKRRGLLKTYVDGVEHQALNAVRSGPHLAQVACPDGQITGQWTTFERELDWIGMCREKPNLKVTRPARG